MSALLRAREAAELVGVSTHTMLRWAREGKVPMYRLPGGGLRVDREELLLALRQPAKPAPKPAKPATAETILDRVKQMDLEQMAARKADLARRARR